MFCSCVDHSFVTGEQQPCQWTQYGESIVWPAFAPLLLAALMFPSTLAQLLVCALNRALLPSLLLLFLECMGVLLFR